MFGHAMPYQNGLKFLWVGGRGKGSNCKKKVHPFGWAWFPLKNFLMFHKNVRIGDPSFEPAVLELCMHSVCRFFNIHKFYDIDELDYIWWHWWTWLHFMTLMNLITFGDSDDIDSMGCTFQSKSDYVNRGTHVLTGAKLHLIPFLRQIWHLYWVTFPHSQNHIYHDNFSDVLHWRQPKCYPFLKSL